ncbi:MAG: hypothetical protein KG028_00160 [Actinobacteria bacterium]|jgi:hypothetical protein|nr:hypothetical protein [Actinomycetota bacterium]
MDLRGRFDDVEVVLHDVAVSRRESGALRLADPDATVDWMHTAEVQLDVHRLPRRDLACVGCGTGLPTEPEAWSPQPLEVPGGHTGPVEVSAPAHVCENCATVHVRRVEQFYSDYLDAIIAAMEAAGVAR